MGIGEYGTAWEVAHIACIYAKVTEALGLKHRQDLYSAKAVGELQCQCFNPLKQEALV